MLAEAARGVLRIVFVSEISAGAAAREGGMAEAGEQDSSYKQGGWGVHRYNRNSSSPASDVGKLDTPRCKAVTDLGTREPGQCDVGEAGAAPPQRWRLPPLSQVPRHAEKSKYPETLARNHAHRLRCRSLPPMQAGKAARLMAEFLASRGSLPVPRVTRRRWSSSSCSPRGGLSGWPSGRAC